MPEKTLVHCYHCGYEWETSSQKSWVTCTNCQRKFNIEKGKTTPETLTHFNLDEHGIRILDRSLATKQSPNGRIIDIYFKHNQAQCEYCQTSDCKHVKYAFTIPQVQAILKKKGWKIS